MINTLIIMVAQYAVIVLPVIVLAVLARLDTPLRIRYIISLVIGGILGLVGILAASHLFYDPRPFVNSTVVPLFHHAPDNGFPSDHTTLSIVLAGITLFFSRKVGILMLFIAVSIGSARVFAHVHSWIDIIGGIVIGTIAALLSLWLSSYFVRKRFQRVPRTLTQNDED